MSVSASGLSEQVFEPSTESKPPVLLLHGFASRGSHDWVATGMVEALVSSGRRAVVVDLPGHGDSPAPSAPAEATADRVVRQIAETIGSIGEIVDVVGYSLGARLAWELPDAAGDRVRRLVLGGISPMEPFAVVDHDALRSAIRDGVAPSDPMTAMVAQLVHSPGQNAEALAMCVEGLARTPFAATPPMRAVPTLLVAGEEDFVAQGIEQLAAVLPDARLVRVPGDHRAALAGVEFRKAVLEFLD